jgi:uncharacterized protein involved in outer membrane biogenesis
MKRFLKIFFGIIGAVLLLLLILPFLFKGKIENKVKSVVNEQVNATVSWDRFSLSLIRNFPNLGIGLDGLTIRNDFPFEGDTLVNVKRFALSVDLMSALRGDDIKVKSILVDRPLINLKVNADSIANWDIMPESELPEVDEVTDDDPSSFQVDLQSFEIRGGSLSFADATMDFITTIKGLNAQMKGDLSASTTTIQIASSIEAFDLMFEKVRYIKNATIDINALIAADLDNFIFTFDDNKIVYNTIPLFMEGTFAMLEEGYDMDLRLAAKATDFKTLLALVPDEYKKDMEGLRTKGSLAFEAKAKGIYIDTDNMPAFNVLLDVKDGGIQYPDLPKSIDNIQIHMLIDNPGGSMDNTLTDIKSFHFELDNNPFDANLRITTPVSNAVFKGAMKGTINLASLMDAIPMDSIEMTGIVKADLSIDGDYNMIDKELYEEIKANGNVSLSAFEFRSPDLPMGFTISDANLQFSPRFVELLSFKSRLGESDFQLKGRLENYLAWALKDATLKGTLAHVSTYINTNELMALAGEEEVDPAASDEPFGKIIVPANLDFDMTTRIDRMLYDKLTMNNTQGTMQIKDSRILLRNLTTNMLNGQVVMNGEYNSQDTLKPFVDFDLAVKAVDINMAANSFTMVESFLPVAKYAKGLVSSNFRFKTDIGDDLSPVLSSFNGAGRLQSDNVEVSGAKVQTALVSMLKDDKYSVANIRDMLVNFAINDGNLAVTPFDVNVFGKKVNIGGTQSLDQNMNFNVKMPVSRSEISNVAGLLGGSLSSTGSDVMVGIRITGKPDDPQLSLSMEDLQQAVKDEVKREVEKAAERAVEEILKDEEVKEKIEETGRRLRDLLR